MRSAGVRAAAGSDNAARGGYSAEPPPYELGVLERRRCGTVGRLPLRLPLQHRCGKKTSHLWTRHAIRGVSFISFPVCRYLFKPLSLSINLQRFRTTLRRFAVIPLDGNHLGEGGTQG